MQKNKKKSNHYVDNQKFYECIVEYKEKVRQADIAGKEKPPIPEFAGECIKLIAENLAENYYKFSRYSYNDEMKSDAIYTCIKYFDSFNEKKYNNPHAYFTRVCYLANVQRIKTEQENQYVKYKSFVDEMILPSNPDIVFHGEHGLINEDVYDNISEYIEDFEIKEKKRKEKRKEKMREKRMRDSLERFMKDED